MVITSVSLVTVDPPGPLCGRFTASPTKEVLIHSVFYLGPGVRLPHTPRSGLDRRRAHPQALCNWTARYEAIAEPIGIDSRCPEWFQISVGQSLSVRTALLTLLGERSCLLGTSVPMGPFPFLMRMWAPAGSLGTPSLIALIVSFFHRSRHYWISLMNWAASSLVTLIIAPMAS